MLFFPHSSRYYCTVSYIKRIAAPEDLSEQLDTLEKKIERLKSLYEQFFLGIEKRPPFTLQREIVRLLQEFTTYHIRKAVLKFRFQALNQRFNVHRSYWQRSIREIEDGTYRRHRLKMERRQGKKNDVDLAELAKRQLLKEFKGEEAVKERARRVDAKPDNAERPKERYVPASIRGRVRRQKKRAGREKPGGRKSATKKPRYASPKRPADSTGNGATGPSSDPARYAPRRTSTQPRILIPDKSDTGSGIGAEDPVAQSPAMKELGDVGISPEHARSIYLKLIAARRSNRQPVHNLTYEKLVGSMARQVKMVQESHSAKRVDFEVVSKNNRIYLKPIPK